MKERVYSVEQVNSYIRNMFSADYLLRRISVGGEISNCKYHSSGHIYFTLKDERSALSCVMFAGDRKGLGFSMKDGDRVVVTGSVDTYIRDGRYQLYAKRIMLQGAGVLYERFLALKAELEKKGLFDPAHKKPVPGYVRQLGIVTAPTGAAVQDIRNISLRRNPYIQLFLYPAQVQGEGAAHSIATGLQVLDQLGLDCIIVGRGGGSIEDLWAFNEEEVAWAIYNCRTPVISAVGHETDTTIADFAADLRAPTPSAGAELAVADVAGILRRLEQYGQRLTVDMKEKIRIGREHTSQVSARLRLVSPARQIRDKRQRLADLEDSLRSGERRILEDRKERLRRTAEQLQAQPERIIREKNQTLRFYQESMRGRPEQILDRSRHRLQILAERMEGLSPVRKLSQGYSYTADENGNNISSVTRVKPGDMLHITVRDGVIHGTVTGTEKKDLLTARPSFKPSDPAAERV